MAKTLTQSPFNLEVCSEGLIPMVDDNAHGDRSHQVVLLIVFVGLPEPAHVIVMNGCGVARLQYVTLERRALG